MRRFRIDTERLINQAERRTGVSEQPEPWRRERRETGDTIDTERLINQAERVGTTIVSAADAVRQGKQEYSALRKEDRQTNRIGESYQAMKRDADEQERTMREELSRRRTPRGGLSDARPDRRTP